MLGLDLTDSVGELYRTQIGIRLGDFECNGDLDEVAGATDAIACSRDRYFLSATFTF